MIGLLVTLLILVAIGIGISKILKRDSKWLGGPIGLLLYGLIFVVGGFLQNLDAAVMLGAVILFIDAIWAFRKWSEKRALKKSLI